MITVLRFQNVFCLSVESEIGSASLPLNFGNLFTSSRNTYLQGLDAKDAGEFAPANVRIIPGKTISRIAKSSSFAGLRSFRTEDALIMGCIRFLEA